MIARRCNSELRIGLRREIMDLLWTGLSYDVSDQEVLAHFHADGQHQDSVIRSDHADPADECRTEAIAGQPPGNPHLTVLTVVMDALGVS